MQSSYIGRPRAHSIESQSNAKSAQRAAPSKKTLNHALSELAYFS